MTLNHKVLFASLENLPSEIVVRTVTLTPENLLETIETAFSAGTGMFLYDPHKLLDTAIVDKMCLINN